MRVRVRACVRMCICRCLGLFLVRDFSCIHAGHAVPGSRSRSLALLPFACLLGSLALPVLACLRICSFCAFLFLCWCLCLCLCWFSRACVWVVAFVRVCVRACARRHWLEVSKSPAASRCVYLPGWGSAGLRCSISHGDPRCTHHAQSRVDEVRGRRSGCGNS